MVRTTLLPLALAVLLRFPAAATADAERPNVVWVTTEDSSAVWHRLYSERGVSMPAVERLAAGGLVFEHAFSNAPVCSVARSTIISGCYAPRVGAQYHRKSQMVPLPGDLKMFPHYLREAGYYTTNNSKEDYNFIRTESAWDESSPRASYRKRADGQPFFHVQNFTTTHEGQLHFDREAIGAGDTQRDPADVKVSPYHPDTPTLRYTYARELEHHRRVDRQIGEFLQQLERDGLMEETIIFYYGDHGGVLPRSKGYLYESGLHVPLVVSFPEKWQHLAPAPPGTRIPGFVSFIDLAPTILHLAGVEVPVEIDGRPFLGEKVALEELNSRNTAFGSADRFDEKYDLVRSWRKGNYKYIRNYQPFNFDSLHNDYRYRMPAYQEWRKLYREGKLNDVQRQFFEPKAVECLYDLDRDPHEVHNLAHDPAHADVLAGLRRELQQQVKSLPDLSFFPEPYFLEHGADNPVGFGQKRREEIAQLIDIADLSLQPFDEVRSALTEALQSRDPWQRYWGCIVCSCFGTEAEELTDQNRDVAESDPEPLVRVRAAEFLGLIGAGDPRPLIAAALADARSAAEANLILNSAVMLEEGQPGYDFTVAEGVLPQEWLQSGRGRGLVGQRLDYLNAAP
jgi:arylsulfatase A-like enzyme